MVDVFGHERSSRLEFAPEVLGAVPIAVREDRLCHRFSRAGPDPHLTAIARRRVVSVDPDSVATPHRHFGVHEDVLRAHLSAVVPG